MLLYIKWGQGEVKRKSSPMRGSKQSVNNPFIRWKIMRRWCTSTYYGQWVIWSHSHVYVSEIHCNFETLLLLFHSHPWAAYFYLHRMSYIYSWCLMILDLFSLLSSRALSIFCCQCWQISTCCMCRYYTFWTFNRWFCPKWVKWNNNMSLSVQ